MRVGMDANELLQMEFWTCKFCMFVFLPGIHSLNLWDVHQLKLFCPEDFNLTHHFNSFYRFGSNANSFIF